MNIGSQIMGFIGFLLYVKNVFSERLLAEFWRRRIIKMSKNNGVVKINGGGVYLGLHGLEVDDNVHIGANAFFMCDGGLKIGENTHISRNVTIYSRNHNYMGEKLPYDHKHIYKKVCIGRNVWIGMNVTILPGTQIGDGCIVGAGSVVYGRIPDMSIVGANGVTKIGERELGHYKQLDAEKRYGREDGR